MQFTTPAVLLIALSLFLVGGVISLARQGLRLFAVILGLAAVISFVAGVLRIDF